MIPVINICLLVWIIMGIAWCKYTIDNSHDQVPWYGPLFLLPLFIIAIPFGFICYLWELYDNYKGLK